MELTAHRNAAIERGPHIPNRALEPSEHGVGDHRMADVDLHDRWYGSHFDHVVAGEPVSRGNLEPACIPALGRAHQPAELVEPLSSGGVAVFPGVKLDLRGAPFS